MRRNYRHSKGLILEISPTLLTTTTTTTKMVFFCGGFREVNKNHARFIGIFQYIFLIIKETTLKPHSNVLWKLIANAVHHSAERILLTKA